MFARHWSETAKALEAKIMRGRVVNAGERARTIRVRVTRLEWNKRVNKYFRKFDHYLVRDPRRSAREGDVVLIRNHWRSAKHVKHLLLSIQKPFNETLEDRPPVPTIQELIEDVKRKRIEQDERQAAKGRIPALDRIKQRQEAEEAELVREKENKLVNSLKGPQAAQFWGKKLAEQHASWAVDPNLTRINGERRYPSNAPFRLRVQEILNKAYKPGAWPLWNAETFKLQQLATLRALIARVDKLKDDSESTRAGSEAYKQILKAKVADLETLLTSSHDSVSVKAVNDLVSRLVEREESLIPRLPTFSAVGIATRRATPNANDTLAERTKQMYISS